LPKSCDTERLDVISGELTAGQQIGVDGLCELYCRNELARVRLVAFRKRSFESNGVDPRPPVTMPGRNAQAAAGAGRGDQLNFHPIPIADRDREPSGGNACVWQRLVDPLCDLLLKLPWSRIRGLSEYEERINVADAVHVGVLGDRATEEQVESFLKFIP
jgi:hypothetical protein